MKNILNMKPMTLIIVSIAILMTGYALDKFEVIGGASVVNPLDKQWAVRYNGASNGYDVTKDVEVDSAGNVYVTGLSYTYSTGYNYMTIKYDSEGNEIWKATYNGPGNGPDNAYAIKVDEFGNVYVTGNSQDVKLKGDFLTIKYDADGNELWTARYDGASHGIDSGTIIDVDGLGNVYVAGYVWVDGAYKDYMTIKYDSEGNELWTAQYNGLGTSYDIINAMELDDEGSVYITGQSKGSSGNDFMTIKYDTNGNEVWTARYNGAAGGYDAAKGIGLDDAGNVYVAGNIKSSTDNDYTTVKYDPDGNQLWAKSYNGPGNGPDYVYGLAVDGSGNSYVTGFSRNTDAKNDFTTVKYDTNGNEVWTARYDSSTGENSVARDIEVDADGNVYVTGYGWNVNMDYMAVKYDSDGNEVWSAVYNSPVNKNEFAYDLEVDARGNIYITGNSEGSGTNRDFLTIKYGLPTPICQSVTGIAIIDEEICVVDNVWVDPETGKSTHGTYVSAVTKLVNQLIKDGKLDKKKSGQITKLAADSEVNME